MGGGGGEGAGGCGHALAAFKVWAVGVVWARGVWARIGSLLSKHLANAS